MLQAVARRYASKYLLEDEALLNKKIRTVKDLYGGIKDRLAQLVERAQQAITKKLATISSIVSVHQLIEQRIA